VSALNGFSCPSASKSRRGRPLGAIALAIRAGVLELVDRHERMTVRQVFYALEVQSVVEKTEGGYRRVQTQVLKMRREGLLPWPFITDGTRWQRKPASWDRVEDFMSHMPRTYRRDLWRAQNVRIEVWLEKDALACRPHRLAGLGRSSARSSKRSAQLRPAPSHWGEIVSLPAYVLAEVQRILDAEARRLLADQLDGDAIGAATGSNPDLSDGGADQGTTGVERKAIPILGSVDDDDGAVAA
jgi:hypothetical protein